MALGIISVLGFKTSKGQSMIKFSKHITYQMSVTGSIIRCMRRLEELLREMCQASKNIGNTELENKFAEGW